MYAEGLACGLSPREFWSLTFFEFSAYTKSIRDADERQWWHTSSLMALHANMNRDSKRQPTPYKPKDFNPYAHENQKAKFVRQFTDEQKDLTRDWVNTYYSNKNGGQGQ